MGKNKHKSTSQFDISKIKYYYGIPHCHSSYSTGKGNPLEVYTAAAKSGLNFLFLTDHNNFLINDVNYKDTIASKWTVSYTITNKVYKNSSNFLPVLGFECKSIYGDFNIINPSSYFTGSIKDLKLLALWMLNNENAFISINHPHKNITALEYNEIYNKLITSLEVCNGNPASKYTRHEKYYYYLLDKGWKLGAINGQDNHRINFSDSDYLTVFIANDLSLNSLINAFRARRTYSTESRFLKLHFFINETFMGGILYTNNKKIKFNIFAEDIKYKITEIQILSNKGVMIKSIENINLNSIKYIYEHTRLPNENWYIIRVIEENTKIAVSSPIFVYNVN